MVGRCGRAPRMLAWSASRFAQKRTVRSRVHLRRGGSSTHECGSHLCTATCTGSDGMYCTGSDTKPRAGPGSWTTFIAGRLDALRTPLGNGTGATGKVPPNVWVGLEPMAGAPRMICGVPTALMTCGCGCGCRTGACVATGSATNGCPSCALPTGAVCTFRALLTADPPVATATGTAPATKSDCPAPCANEGYAAAVACNCRPRMITGFAGEPTTELPGVGDPGGAPTPTLPTTEVCAGAP